MSKIALHALHRPKTLQKYRITAYCHHQSSPAPSFDSTLPALPKLLQLVQPPLRSILSHRCPHPSLGGVEGPVAEALHAVFPRSRSREALCCASSRRSVQFVRRRRLFQHEQDGWCVKQTRGVRSMPSREREVNETRRGLIFILFRQTPGCRRAIPALDRPGWTAFVGVSSVQGGSFFSRVNPG